MSVSFSIFKQRRIWMSLVLYLCYFSGGLFGTEVGPTITILARDTNSDEGTVSFAFTARYIGYMAVFGGPAIDLINREGLLMGGFLLVTGALNIVIPFIKNIYAVLVLMGVQGIATGIFEPGIGVCLLHLHGEKVAPWMEGIHFLYALGTMVGPLIVGATLKNELSTKPSYIGFGIVTIVASVLTILAPSFKARKGNKCCMSISDYKEEKKLLKEAAKKEKESEEANYGTAYARKQKVLNKPVFFWTFTVLVALLLCVYSTIENSIGGLISLYSMYIGAADEVVGSYMTSVFYGSFAVGKLIAIPVSMFVSPEIILAVSIFGCFVECALFTAFTSSTALWAIMATIGIFMGPIWPTLWVYVGKHITLSGVAGTVVAIGASIGSMTVPTLVGNLMTPAKNYVLPVQCVICATIQLLLFFVIFGVFTWISHREKRNQQNQ